MVEYLSSNWKVLSSISSTAKNKKGRIFRSETNEDVKV
jgi:hypothetical protein